MANNRRPLPVAPAGSTFVSVSRFVRSDDGYDPAALRALIDAYKIPSAYSAGECGPAEDEAVGSVEALIDLWRTFARTDADVEADQVRSASLSSVMMLTARDGLRHYLREKIVEWSNEPPQRADFGRGWCTVMRAALIWAKN